MNSTFKKAMLASTAIVAVGFTATQAHAVNEFTIDANNDGVFGEAAVNSPLDADADVSADDVRVNGNGSIEFSADGTIGDGTTSTPGIIANANGLTLIIDNINNNSANEIATINGGISAGGNASLNLNIYGEDGDNVGTDGFVVDVNGDVNLGTGVLNLDSDTNAGNFVQLDVSGNLTASTVNLIADGGSTEIVFDGSTAQVVNANIEGDNSTSGDFITVANAAGVTFNGTIGAVTHVDRINVFGSNINSTATFTDDVSMTTGITLGDGANANTNTVIFDTTNTAGGTLTVTGTVAGTANDTDIVTLTGGNTVVTTAAWSALQVLNINANTTLTSGSTIAATDLNIAAAAVLNAGADVTADVDFTGATGTLALADGQDITGTVDNDSGTAGRGTLTIADTSGGGDAASVISGNVGGGGSLAAVTLTGNGQAVFQGTVNATTITTTTGTISFDGTTVTGAVNIAGAGSVDLASGTDMVGAINNTSGVAGTGSLYLGDAGGTNDISGIVGASNTLGLIEMQGTGTANFASDVNAALLDFNNNAGTVNFNAASGTTLNIADLDFGDAAGTVTLADGVNFTGSIRDTNDGEGIVNFTGSSTVTGNVGTNAANDIQDVSFNGGAGKAVSVSGTVFVADDIEVDGAGTATIIGQATTGDDVAFTADGTINFGDSLVTIGDDITTGTDGQGTVNFAGSGTVTGDIGTNANRLKLLTVGGTSGETLAIGNDFFAADTVTIGENAITAGGVVNFASGQTLNVTVTGGPAASGSITATGNATVNAGTLVVINVDGTGNYISNQQSFTLIAGTGGAGVADLAAGNITDTSYLLNFTQDTTDDDDLVVLAQRTSLEEAGTSDNNSSVGQALEETGTSGDDDLDQVQNNLNAADSQEEVNDILESLTPTNDGAAVAATFNTSVQSLEITNTRLASLRNGEASTGMVAGEMGQGVTAWIQAFGQSADQRRRNGVDGYEAETLGFAAGLDTENIHDSATVGLALSYARTDAESENINSTDTDINSYQVSLYGDYDLDQYTYLESMLAYAHNNIEQDRHNVGLLGSTASADFDSDQFIVYAEAGRDYTIAERTTLTPSVLAHYQHIAIDDYTEEGAGGLNLDVDNDGLNILELGVGAELGWNLDAGNGASLRPAVNVGYRYDLIGDEVQSTSNFTGGGASFDTNGIEPARSTFNVGTSIEFANTSGWEFTADYNFEYKSDYDAHSGYLRAGYKF